MGAAVATVGLRNRTGLISVLSQPASTLCVGSQGTRPDSSGAILGICAGLDAFLRCLGAVVVQVRSTPVVD